MEMNKRASRKDKMSNSYDHELKMNMLDKQIEKTAYKYINTWIRSPGCLLTFCFGLNRLMHPETKNDYIFH